MPLQSAKAMVIGTTVFNEQDKIVHLLTSGEGIKKVVAKGSSKGRNRFGSLLELFTEGEFFFYAKENRDLATLSKGEVIVSYFETVSAPDRVFYFYLMAEILMKFVPRNFDTERIYKLVKSVLQNSPEHPDISQLLLYYMTWILRIEGMMFETGRCGACGKFSPDTGWVMHDYRGIVCDRCRTGEQVPLGSRALEYAEWSKRNDTSAVFTELSEADRKNLFQVLKNKIEFHGEIALHAARYLADLT